MGWARAGTCTWRGKRRECYQPPKRWLCWNRCLAGAEIFSQRTWLSTENTRTQPENQSVPCPEAPLSTIPIGQTWPKVGEWARVDAVLHSSALQAQSVVELDRGWVWRGRWQLPTTDVVKYSCIDWDIPLFSIDTMELLSVSLSLQNT